MIQTDKVYLNTEIFLKTHLDQIYLDIPAL